jgi:hypothetical protein
LLGEGFRCCAIRPRRNATTAARSRSSQGSKPCGRNYRTDPFSRANPNKMKPLAPLRKRTRFPPKTPLPRPVSGRPSRRLRPALPQANPGGCRNTAVRK